MNKLLRIEKLVKHFGHGKKAVTVLNHVDLDIHAGEIVGLAGESGSGKSTLARCIAGLHSYDSGAVYFQDALLPKNSARWIFASKPKSCK
ncbi:MAG: ATP-binding cassette domain-containing protein [Cellvibrionales bacterium]|nr:ATP-binding cassette domain-containing protein [Cellvibrionales bacterium]